MTGMRKCQYWDCFDAGELIPASNGAVIRGEWFCDGCVEDLQDHEQEETEVRAIMAELGQRY